MMLIFAKSIYFLNILLNIYIIIYFLCPHFCVFSRPTSGNLTENYSLSMMRWRGSSLLLCIFLFVSYAHAGAQELDSTRYLQLPGFPFVFVSDASVTEPPVITDSLFDAVARGIRFMVNRTELLQDVPFIPLYNDGLVPWLKSQDMELRQMYIKGAASLEGPYLNNVRLSRARTARLIEFLSAGLDQPAESLPHNAQSITEDYGRLVRMLQQAGDPDYEKVNTIWQQSGGDEQWCKKQMMALEGGKVWKRLLVEYFPILREARVILWFARKQDSKRKDQPLRPRAIAPRPIPTLLPYCYPPFDPREPVYSPVVEKERRHLLAVRTNLLHDFLYVPKFGFAPGANVQLEYYPLTGHYTANAGFTFTNHRHWDEYKFFQIRDLQLELRRYFRGGGEFMGPYLGAYAEGTVYGIGFGKTKGWEGEGGGAGLSAGWVWPLNRKGNLRLEVSASLGVFYSRFDPYVYGNPITGNEDGLYYYDYYGNTSEFIRRNHELFWLGPTNAGIHITYDILYRK